MQSLENNFFDRSPQNAQKFFGSIDFDEGSNLNAFGSTVPDDRLLPLNDLSLPFAEDQPQYDDMV